MAPIIWKDGEHFAPKLKQITDLIDRLADRGNQISLKGYVKKRWGDLH